jgi:hypothetical protein
MEGADRKFEICDFNAEMLAVLDARSAKVRNVLVASSRPECLRGWASFFALDGVVSLPRIRAE